MANPPPNDVVTFNRSVKASFLQHLLEHPNERHIAQTERENIIQWLTNPHKRPSSQKEFSRRNYIWRTFAWDETTHNLLAVSKTHESKNRMVVTVDMIADVVELVHENNNHAGWDATWKDVSTSYYGILRSDVIFLLKQCHICAYNPCKRPKGTTKLNSQSVGHKAPSGLEDGDQYIDFCDLQGEEVSH